MGFIKHIKNLVKTLWVNGINWTWKPNFCRDESWAGTNARFIIDAGTYSYVRYDEEIEFTLASAVNLDTVKDRGAGATEYFYCSLVYNVNSKQFFIKETAYSATPSRVTYDIDEIILMDNYLVELAAGAIVQPPLNDSDFFHKSIANEFDTLPEKTVLTGNELVLAEDPANNYRKTKIPTSSIVPDLSGYVTKALYDANTMLLATLDNTPFAATKTQVLNFLGIGISSQYFEVTVGATGANYTEWADAVAAGYTKIKQIAAVTCTKNTVLSNTKTYILYSDNHNNLTTWGNYIFTGGGSACKMILENVNFKFNKTDNTDPNINAQCELIINNSIIDLSLNTAYNVFTISSKLLINNCDIATHPDGGGNNGIFGTTTQNYIIQNSRLTVASGGALLMTVGNSFTGSLINVIFLGSGFWYISIAGGASKNTLLDGISIEIADGSTLILYACEISHLKTKSDTVVYSSTNTKISDSTIGVPALNTMSNTIFDKVTFLSAISSSTYVITNSTFTNCIFVSISTGLVRCKILSSYIASTFAAVIASAIRPTFNKISNNEIVGACVLDGDYNDFSHNTIGDKVAGSGTSVTLTINAAATSNTIISNFVDADIVDNGTETEKVSNTTY